MKLKDLMDNEEPNEVTELYDRNGVSLSIEAIEDMDINLEVIKILKNPTGLSVTLAVSVEEEEIKRKEFKKSLEWDKDVDVDFEESQQIRKEYACEGIRGDIVLLDGTTIDFIHEQDCFESVYADLSSLDNTGFYCDQSITKDNIKIEFVEDYGIRINGYGIACYNEQNGYYNSDIKIRVSYKGKVLYTKEFDASQYGKNSDY